MPLVLARDSAHLFMDVNDMLILYSYRSYIYIYTHLYIDLFSTAFGYTYKYSSRLGLNCIIKPGYQLLMGNSGCMRPLISKSIIKESSLMIQSNPKKKTLNHNQSNPIQTIHIYYTLEQLILLLINATNQKAWGPKKKTYVHHHLQNRKDRTHKSRPFIWWQPCAPSHLSCSPMVCLWLIVLRCLARNILLYRYVCFIVSLSLSLSFSKLI